MKKYGMKKRAILLFLALFLLALAAGCTQETHHSEISLPEQEKAPVTEEATVEPEAPTYLNLTVQALYEGLLDADCPEAQAEQIAAWLDEHPGYTSKVEGASCEYAIAENGIERVRFLIANSDRFSRYSDDACKTVVYQLWLVDGAVREGASGVLTPLEPDYRLYEDHMLAGFYIGQPTWEIDLTTLDGFYAVKPALLTGFASECDWCDEHYTNGAVTLCFITTGMEYLVHIHVQSGDADYLGVRVGDSVDDLIETIEKQKDKAYWVIYRESHQIAGYGLGIDYAEQDGRITELELFAFV